MCSCQFHLTAPAIIVPSKAIVHGFTSLIVMCQEKCYSSDEAIIAQMAQFVKMVWLHYVKEGARLRGGRFPIYIVEKA